MCVDFESGASGREAGQEVKIWGLWTGVGADPPGSCRAGTPA